MKKRWLTILSVLAGLGIMAGLAGCGSKFREFRYRSDYEAGVAKMVRQTLMNFESAYNRKDPGGIAPHFYENAQIVNEGGIRVFSRGQFFKGQFAEVFTEAFKRFPSMAVGSPYAFMVLPTRDKAVMEAITTFGEVELRTKVSMILDGDRWLIVKILYWTT